MEHSGVIGKIGRRKESRAQVIDLSDLEPDGFDPAEHRQLPMLATDEEFRVSRQDEEQDWWFDELYPNTYIHFSIIL